MSATAILRLLNIEHFSKVRFFSENRIGQYL
jgi:hypothetical protein